MLTRRFVLAAAAATAASSAIPAGATALAPAPSAAAKWFLVSTEEHCEFIRAASEDDAITSWVSNQVGATQCEAITAPSGPAPEDCDCDVCCARDSVMGAYHAKRLDGQATVGLEDYWHEGCAVTCSQCDAHVVAGEGSILDGACWCHDCLGRDMPSYADHEHVAELRAEQTEIDND